MADCFRVRKIVQFRLLSDQIDANDAFVTHLGECKRCDVLNEGRTATDSIELCLAGAKLEQSLGTL